MTIERFTELMDGESDYSKHKDKCRVTAGLIIITKYTGVFGIEGAEHDIVYSVDTERITATDITEEEVITLRELGWFIDEKVDSLAHFC